jgi:hypothetical protein
MAGLPDHQTARIRSSGQHQTYGELNTWIVQEDCSLALLWHSYH